MGAGHPQRPASPETRQNPIDSLVTEEASPEQFFIAKEVLLDHRARRVPAVVSWRGIPVPKQS
jgi:hypothetical protein